jgi:hypothetical protein
MPQEATSQELTANGGGSTTNTSGGSFSTGQTCTISGTYVAENRYMRHVMAVAAGEAFPPFVDGKKCTWTALTTVIASSGTAKTADGGFTGVKVEAGTV